MEIQDQVNEDDIQNPEEEQNNEGYDGGYESPDQDAEYDYVQQQDIQDHRIDSQTIDDISKTYQTSDRSHQGKGKADAYTLHINSLQKSVKHYNKVLNKLRQKIKDGEDERDAKNQLLQRFKSFRKQRSKVNQKELKQNLEVAQLDLSNYQLQVAQVKNHIKNLTKHERINQLNLKLKKRSFQIEEITVKQRYLKTFIKEQKKQIKKLTQSKKYFSDATYNLNQQFLQLKNKKVKNLQKREGDQQKRIDGYQKILKFKQQESRQLLENIIELETTYREICQKNHMKEKLHMLKSPFYKQHGSKGKRKRPKSKRVLNAIKNAYDKGMKSAKVVRKNVDNITGKAADIYNELKTQRLDSAMDNAGTFLTGAKGMASNISKQFSKFDSSSSQKQQLIGDEKIQYQKQVRELMNQLKGEYQAVDNIRYETQDKTKEFEKQIVKKQKQLELLKQEDKDKILKALQEQFKDVQHEFERKMSYQKDRLTRVGKDREELLNQQANTKFNMDKKLLEIEAARQRLDLLKQSILNPGAFLNSKQQKVFDLIGKKNDENYTKLQEGMFDPETYLFSDEKALHEQTVFRITRMKFAHIQNYIIYVEVTYENITTGEEHTQEHYYGDLPENVQLLNLEFSQDDKLEKIVMMKDKKDFIRSIAFFTEKEYRQLGEYDEGEELYIQVTEEYQEMFCLMGAFASLISSKFNPPLISLFVEGENVNLVALTGLGMCVKDIRKEPRYQNTQMAEQMLYDLMDNVVDKSEKEKAEREALNQVLEQQIKSYEDFVEKWNEHKTDVETRYNQIQMLKNVTKSEIATIIPNIKYYIDFDFSDNVIDYFPQEEDENITFEQFEEGILSWAKDQDYQTGGLGEGEGEEDGELEGNGEDQDEGQDMQDKQDMDGQEEDQDQEDQDQE